MCTSRPRRAPRPGWPAAAKSARTTTRCWPSSSSPAPTVPMRCANYRPRWQPPGWRALAASPMFCGGRIATGSLADFAYRPRAFEVLEPGLQTTVQDWPGRQGYWDVGVPPSGPMDDLGFRLANRLVGNDSAAAGLECTLKGP